MEVGVQRLEKKEGGVQPPSYLGKFVLEMNEVFSKEG